MKYVQFNDATQAAVVAVFAFPQNPDFFANYAEVEDTDERYLRFVQPVVATVADIIADARFLRETAGVTIDDMAVFTDRTTQSKLTAASLRATRDATYTVEWKLSTGGFATLNAVQILAIADAVGDYVQACYSREAQLLAALENGTYQGSMLDEGWPSTVLSTGAAA